MGVDTTVVFVDLTGSSRVFEAMGNARATETVTHLIQGIGAGCEAHGGRVIKTLGDGLFAIFSESSSAVAAVIELQRSHQERVMMWPDSLRMELQIGVARGAVVEVDGDFFGDAVNLASRLSERAGPGQIWVSDAVISELHKTEVRHRNLGPIAIRGKVETPVVHRIDWHEDLSMFLTMPAALEPQVSKDPAFGQIELSWLSTRSMFEGDQLPIHLGRIDEAHFTINHPRVSRLHARIELRQGSCVLTDISTYGTWVRFQDGDGVSNEIALRREECVLYGRGEISLGSPFNDLSSPTIAFKTIGGNVLLAHHDPR